MARKRINMTRYEIIQTATTLFLERGYSHTTPKLISEELDISTGNLTYYFPAKEHLLSVLVEMLCNFQRQTMQNIVQEGKTSLLAACLELAAMCVMCEESEIAKDLFVSAYSSPICLDIIRKNDARRARQIYKEFCPDWTDSQYIEAEILVSGIEYATLMTTNDSVPVQQRITGALDSVMKIYNIPEDIRLQNIHKILSTDYLALGAQVLEQFKQFVKNTNEHAFEALLDSANN